MSILDMKFWSLIGLKKKPKARWSKYYSKKEMNIDVPNISIYQLLKNKSLENNYKDNVALEYFGTKLTFQDFSFYYFLLSLLLDFFFLFTTRIIFNS